MRLFNIDGNELNTVDEKSFPLEKDIQKLIEPNMKSVFDLTFVKSEFSVGNYRIDSLCYDEESRSFVIVEYKKGHSYSVVDQGFTYLQLLLNNRAEFILLLEQHFDKLIKRDDIDWSQSRIIFVSPSFNRYQKDSVNFKGMPFELWEIKQYSNNTVVLNQHKSNSNESISKIASQKEGALSKAISDVSREVKTVSFEDHYRKVPADVLEVYERLCERFLDWDGVELFSRKAYICLSYDGWTICYFIFSKSGIGITMRRGTKRTDGSYSEGFLRLNDPKNVAKAFHRSYRTGEEIHDYAIPLRLDSDIDYLLFLIKQNYNRRAT